MPFITDPNGKTQYVPGVYTAQRVVSNLPGAAPQFLVPVLLGGGPEGHPYNADASKQVQEASYTPFKLVATSAAAKDYFGEDSDIGVAMSWAKKHGLPYAYVANMGALTRAAVIVTSTGPITQFTLYPRSWGAPANHIKIKATSGTAFEFTPIKHYSMLTANIASGDTRLFIKDNSWVRVGMTITLADNVTTNVTKTVLGVGFEYTSTGQKKPYVDITATAGSAFTTANYGMLLEYDDANVESSGVLTNAQALVDWVNNSSKLFIAVKAGTFSNPAALIAVASATVLKDIAAWSTVTKGTSPAPTSSDYTSFVALMEATAWDLFVQQEGVLPQAFYVADSSSTIHATMRDWAIDKRAEGHPISVTTGGAWGDVVLSAGNDTDPLYRANALNSQDVMLCAGGLDRVAAYLSLGPAVWGRRIDGGLGHNLTNDSLLYSEVEKQWDERVSLNLTNLHRRGVVSYRLGEASKRYVISQGLSTLQGQGATAWNEGTNDTPLVMQRDLADFIDRTLREDLDGSQVGADRVSPETLAAVIVRRAQRTLEPRGYIAKGSFRITSIALNEGGTGYDVVWSVRLPTTTDFITATTSILIGEE